MPSFGENCRQSMIVRLSCGMIITLETAGPTCIHPLAPYRGPLRSSKEVLAKQQEAHCILGTAASPRSICNRPLKSNQGFSSAPRLDSLGLCTLT